MVSCLSSLNIIITSLFQIVIFQFIPDCTVGFQIASQKLRWEYADITCKRYNNTLIEMTERNDLALAIELSKNQKFLSEGFRFWTIHRMSTKVSDISFEKYPNEDVDDLPPNRVFCVCAIFYPDQMRIGWFSDDCTVQEMFVCGTAVDQPADFTEGFFRANTELPWNLADRSCKLKNNTLIKMTERTDLELTAQLLRDPNVLSGGPRYKFWTIHRISTKISNISFEEFPNEAVDNLLSTTVFCVCAIFYPDKKRFGWFSDNCTTRQKFVCRSRTDGEREGAPKNVTFYSYKTNQEDAKAICARNGQTLLEIEDEDKKVRMSPHFKENPWLNKGISTFWTVHRSPVEVLQNSDAPFPNTSNVDASHGYCVIAAAVLTMQQNQMQLGWSTEDCKSGYHSFMCEKTIESCYYSVFEDKFSPNPSYDSEVNSVKECERECKLIVLMGTACGGFNYHRDTNTCSYVKLVQDVVQTQPDSDHDFHAKRCTVRPLVDDNVWNNSVSTTSDHETTASLSSYQETTSSLSATYHTSKNIISTEDNKQTSKDLQTTRSRLLTTLQTSRQGPSTEREHLLQTTTRPKCRKCKCKPSNKTLEEKIADIVRDIKVDRKETSAYRRKFISAPDSRILSKGMGFTAGAILVSIGISVVLMDSHRITSTFRIILRAVRRFVLSMT